MIIRCPTLYIDAAEKLVVGRADFMHALENDVKPAFGASQEVLEGFMARGIEIWGQPVQDVLDDGALLIQQAASADGPGLVSILLEGTPNAGKTAIAAQLAKMSGFPFVKICSPEDMVRWTFRLILCRSNLNMELPLHAVLGWLHRIC